MASLLEKYGRHAGLLSPLSFLALTLLAIMNYRGYDPFLDYLSHLGTNPHSALIFNFGIFISGMLGIVFSLYLWKGFPRGPAKSGAFLMACALAFFSMLSVFTEQDLQAHVFFAFVFFSLALASLILIGTGIRGLDSRLSLLSLLAAALILPLPLSGLHPLAEHVAAASIVSWSLAMWHHLGQFNDGYLRYEWVWM